MTTVSVTCKVCHIEFEPTDADIRAGRWHTCPACRELGEGGLRPRGRPVNESGTDVQTSR